MNEKDDNIHRLEGSVGTQKGGLVIMKKNSSAAGTEENHQFKKPEVKASLLGLDKLAASKRTREEKPVEYSKRQYRDRVEESPSHSDGVSLDYVRKAAERRQHDRGVGASSE